MVATYEMRDGFDYVLYEDYAAIEAERDALRAEVEKWKFAVLERYPVSMEFDCANPGLMIENICRARVYWHNNQPPAQGGEEEKDNG
jgi:hypothetical protein